MSDKFKVTAAITTYKRDWASINRAIESIVNQTKKVEEILLIDDNDPDTEYRKNVFAIAQKDSRINYIPLEKNGGVCNARNVAIMRAKGNVIGFLDDDDEWCMDKIEKLVKVFEEHPDAGIAFGTGLVINDDTGEKSENWQYRVFKPMAGYEDMLCNDYVGSASAPLISMKALMTVGCFKLKKQPAVEDYELWIRISSKFMVYGIKDHVFIKHMDSTEHVSQNTRRTFLGFRNIYKVNREAYDRNLDAKLWITWNITRQAVKSLDIRGFPYFCKWLVLKARRKKN